MNEQAHTNLDVSSIQRGCIHDGDGVRTTVFLNGCHLHCPWCCNPETSHIVAYFVDSDKCEEFRSSSLCADCFNHGGGRPLHECPFGAVKPTSSRLDIAHLFETLLKDKNLYHESEGGVTFSGGEPMLQIDALTPLLSKLTEAGINIAIETTLYVPAQSVELSAPYIDEYIIDLKLQPSMFLDEEKYLSIISSNLELIQSKRKRFRIVFFNGVESRTADIITALKLLNIKDIEILKCHNLAENKYKKLGLDFAPHEVTDSNIECFAKALSDAGINSITMNA